MHQFYLKHIMVARISYVAHILQLVHTNVWGKPCSYTQLTYKKPYFYYKSRKNPYQYYKSISKFTHKVHVVYTVNKVAYRKVVYKIESTSCHYIWKMYPPVTIETRVK